MDNVTEAASDARLLWIDLEMTGLVANRDKILEVAAIITDWEFKELAEFHSGVGQKENEVGSLLDANPFYVKMKDNKRALLELANSSPPSQIVEQQLMKFITEHCDMHRPVVLAGNSIHIDRQFISAAWPHLEQVLHYRMLDVTAWKLVFEAKYGIKHEKRETHRALEDVKESIAEMKNYISRINL